MKEIAAVAQEAAKEAGKFLLDNFGRVSKIDLKGDRNLATNLDREAEQMIISRVKDAFPGHGIIAEESGKFNPDSEYLWIIDPLDGTHNFIRNINIFGVSIGVLRRGEFIAGAIYMPLGDELYSGQINCGAYKNGRKIEVSKNSTLKECTVSFDSSIRYSPGPMLRVLKDLSLEVFNVRMLGSSARHLSYLCEGVFDFSVEFHDRPWDFAGGVAIIREAGGINR